MSAIKIVFNGEVRRLSIGEDTNSSRLSFFIGTVKSLFPRLQDQPFLTMWQDEEGDWISVSSDAEYREALRIMTASPSKLLRFTLKLLDAANPSATDANTSGRVSSISSDILHNRVTCDECGMSPIRGIRYKCAVREDFDLCEKCEALKLQPYPMIKIYDPDQSPSALIFAFCDEQKRGREGVWRRGMRPPVPGGFHHPPPPYPHPHPHANLHAHPHPIPHAHPFLHHPPPPFANREPSGCGRRGQRRRELMKQCPIVETVVAPFIAAMDAEKSILSDDAAGDKDRQDAEEQLLQEAIEESLHINETSQLSSAKSAAFVETYAPSVFNLPKPALRFVKDITFPDGTAVPPGTVFRKAWRVRNDGPHAWPSGVVLKSAGGDLMCAESMKTELPSLGSNEEAEIAVTLSAPEAPGLYTAYFRAQTAEEQNFGHRLWASIMVNEENDWAMLSQHLQPSKESVSKCDTSPTPEPTASSAQMEAAADASVVSTTEVLIEDTDPKIKLTPSTNIDPSTLLWRRELEILADMGFTNTVDIIPLLQNFLQVPVSLAGDRSAAPSVDGMQRVVATLLSATVV